LSLQFKGGRFNSCFLFLNLKGFVCLVKVKVAQRPAQHVSPEDEFSDDHV